MSNIFNIFIVTRQRTRINIKYRLNRYCSIVIERNLQLTCFQKLHQTFNKNPAKISKKRRSRISSYFVFSPDGTICAIRDFDSLDTDFNDFYQPPLTPPPQPQIDCTQYSPTPPTTPTLPTPPVSPKKPAPPAPLINPFQHARGGFQLFGRRPKN